MHMYCRLQNNTVYDIIKVNSNSYFLPSVCSILTFQSSMRSLTRAFRGAIYTAYKTIKINLKWAQKFTCTKFNNYKSNPHQYQKWAHFCVWIFSENAKYSQFSCNCLSGASRCTEQHITVSVIKRMEDLCLDRIEVSEVVQWLQAAVIQGRDWQWLQIKQLWTCTHK